MSEQSTGRNILEIMRLLPHRYPFLLVDRILSLTDTGLRVGGDASIFEFYVEVFPDELPSFNATTRQAISDDSRDKFEAGHTIYVKFDPANPKYVAVGGVPVESPARVVICPNCGATQTLVDGQTACDYCRRPLGM